MQNLNQFSKQDLDKLKSIYKEMNFILSKCQDGIEKALCDEERKRAIFHTLITIKEKLDKLCETSLDEKILSLFDEKFKMRIKTTRNIAAHESEELNLRAVKNFILYDLKDTSLRIKGFLDEIYSAERAQSAREIKSGGSITKIILITLLTLIAVNTGALFVVEADINKTILIKSLMILSILTVICYFVLTWTGSTKNKQSNLTDSIREINESKFLDKPNEVQNSKVVVIGVNEIINSYLLLNALKGAAIFLIFLIIAIYLSYS